MVALTYFSPEKIAEMVGKENVDEMLTGYHLSLSEAIMKLQSAFESQEANTINHIAHTMKSSSRFVGAEELGNAFQNLELATLNDVSLSTQTEMLFCSITEQSKLLEDEISQYLNQSNGIGDGMELNALKVICVDDDEFMLKAIGRLIRRLRPDWQLMLVSDPLAWKEEWHKVHDELPAIIISDLLMPKLRGDELLEEFRNRYPQVVRVLLTGDTTNKLPQKAHAYSHFVIPKPFTEDDFERLFVCTERLYQMPFNDECRTKLGGFADLPVLPTSVRRLQQTIASPTCDITAIADTISHEPALVARVFQIANSSYFGFRRHTESLSEAVGRLGATLIETIAVSLLCHHTHHYVSRHEHQKVAEQALRVSCIAQLLAKQFECSRLDQDRVFVASLLTSIGTLILLEEGAALDAVDSFIGLQNGYADSHIIAAYVLIIWGYDIEIGDIILNQGKSDFPEDKLLLLGSIVGLATRIEISSNDVDYQAIMDSVPDVVAAVLNELKPMFIE
nr:HDOD domain-containing protein [Vibrio qinghaiensis]